MKQKKKKKETGSLIHNCPLQTYSPKMLMTLTSLPKLFLFF